jgi:small conductance mechanosensitive channel
MGTRVLVLISVKAALERAGINIPFEIQTQIFRDETPPELVKTRADISDTPARRTA